MNFYYTSPSELRLPSQPAVPIRDGAAAAPPAAAASGAPSYPRPYANSARNSRVPWRIPAQPLAVRWQSELYPQFAARFVLTAGDRIVAAGRDSWRVLDDAGKTIGEDRLAAGDIVLDSGPGIFLFPDTIGRISAHQLKDASKAFSLSLFFGAEFRRDFIERFGRRVLALSVELPTDPHGGSKPSKSVIELQEFGETFVFSETRRMKSATRVNYLKRETVNLLASTEEETIALASENSVYLADRELVLQREFTGEFTPVSLSLDEQASLYLVVKTGEAVELWKINRDGQRVTRHALAPEFEGSGPPVVGYDHKVYVLAGRHIAAINPDGKAAWTRELDADVSGVVATADNRLLVTAGSQLLTLDAGGTPNVLFTSEDRLRTPAAPTSAGDIVIAGERQIYCLRPQ
jgi:hypothetical protein